MFGFLKKLLGKGDEGSAPPPAQPVDTQAPAVPAPTPPENSQPAPAAPTNPTPPQA